MKMLDAADLFCGAGGMTEGARESGCVRVKVAVNHWRTAIATHQTNHPETRHICAEMEHVDPAGDQTLPDIDIIMAGVSCTHHSNAKGGSPVSDQKRSTGRHVIDWARAKQPDWIVVENVREWRDWGPTRLKLDANGNRIWDRKHRQWAREADPDHKGEYFRAWIAALKRMGYHVEHQLLNSADYGEAQKRVRLFVIARLGRGPIPWPEPTHAKNANGKPRWRGAEEIIDFSKPAPSIFGRKKPLAPKTLRRIEIGLWRFSAPKTIEEAVARAGRKPEDMGPWPLPLVHIDMTSGSPLRHFLVKLRGTNTTADCREPLPTITAGGTHLGLAYLVNMKGRSSVADIQAPSPTITAHAQHLYIAQPFIVKYHSGAEQKWRNGQSPLWEPMPTLDTQPRFGLVEPFVFGVDHRGSNGAPRRVGQPLTTVTVKQRHCLAEPFVYQLIGRGAGRSYAIDAPLPTVLASREQSELRRNSAVPHATQSHREHGQGELCLRSVGAAADGDRHNGVAMPFLLPRQGFYDSRRLKRCASIDEPLNAITASHAPAHLVVPYLIEVNHGEADRSPGGRVHSVAKPLGTVTTHRTHGLILPEPFVVKYNGTAVGHSVREPLSTVTTKHRHGLALFNEEAEPAKKIVVLNAAEARLWRTMDMLGIADIGFRMLEDDELAAAMGLPADYYLHGNKAERIKQIGNMVCVGVMRAICRAIGQAA